MRARRYTADDAAHINNIMCGIIGYTGHKNARDIILDGLKTLEYRGYDSAGVAFGGDKLSVYKTAGRVSALEAMLPVGEYGYGIGHTRWATHGKPNAVNAHPHLSFDGRVAAVHNGVLENCAQLKAELKQAGIECASETDSEVIAHMLALRGGDMLDATRYVGSRLKGAATFLAICAGDERVYAFRQGASMLVACENGEGYAASDGLALAKYCRSAIALEDGECARVSRGEVEIFRDGRRIQKRQIALKQLPPEYRACNMRAEIDEIPSALERTFLSVSKAADGDIAGRIRRARRLVFAGCGTAYHACLYGKQLFAGMGKAAEAVPASEADGVAGVDGGTVAIFVSQSGETADALLALKRFKAMGAYTVGITNVEGSSLSVAADRTFYLDAGAEVAVAATKSYVCQLLAIYMLARLAAGARMTPREAEGTISAAKVCLASDGLYEDRLAGGKIFFVGRGQDHVTAREGALKLKEITYRQAEAYAAGELKHGPIALIDEDSIVICIATRQDYLPRICATVSELRSRGAYTIGVSGVGDIGADRTLHIPQLFDERLCPILSAIPLMELALSASLRLGLDPDRPRNLAKSVTVI